MSTVRANAILDAAGGNTATINGILPISESMTLLGTLNTTSGTTQTLSGLNLTGYKSLHVSYSEIALSGADNLSFGTLIVGLFFGGTSRGWGSFWVDLNSGAAGGGHARLVSSPGVTAIAGSTGYTNATTSVSVTAGAAAAPFLGGAFRIYGVR